MRMRNTDFLSVFSLLIFTIKKLAQDERDRLDQKSKSLSAVVEELKAGEVLVYTVDIKIKASTEELELTGLKLYRFTINTRLEF